MDTLNKEDIKALKTADTLIFSINGEAKIKAIKDHKDKTFSDCNGLIHRDIIVSGDMQYGKYKKASYYMSTGEFNDLWKTIVSLLKPGDKLRLVVGVNDFQNQYLKEVDLNSDVMYLYVNREKTNKRFKFFLGCETGPDNSNRMVQV